MSSPRLTHDFYRRRPVTVARALLGQTLVHIVDGGRMAGVIVETEAYLGVADKAAHTYRGRHTERNDAMWRDGGHAYVYFTYGMHHCMNVVAGREAEPVAVLLRALQPTEGIERMRDNRKLTDNAPLTAIASGPGKLCQALAISRKLSGVDMTRSDELFIERTRAKTFPAAHIATTTRIGIAYAAEWTHEPLRFYLKGNAHVSRR